MTFENLYGARTYDCKRLTETQNETPLGMHQCANISLTSHTIDIHVLVYIQKKNIYVTHRT